MHVSVATCRNGKPIHVPLVFSDLMGMCGQYILMGDKPYKCTATASPGHGLHWPLHLICLLL